MNEDFAILLFFFGISLTGNLALLVGFIRSSRRARRFERELLSQVPPEDDGRAERAERALEALAAQIDQLASGQEFLHRVMTGRLERPSQAPPDEAHDLTPR